MATAFSKVYDAFDAKMETDKDFYNYLGLDDNQSLELAHERAHDYIIESVARLCRECDSDVNFSDYDEDLKRFNIDLTFDEIDMIANLMYECNYKREFSRLKAFEVNYTPSDLNVFSPSNSRKSFIEMYQQIRKENSLMLDRYQAKNRTDHSRKTIDYSAYSDDE